MFFQFVNGQPFPFPQQQPSQPPVKRFQADNVEDAVFEEMPHICEDDLTRKEEHIGKEESVVPPQNPV